MSEHIIVLADRVKELSRTTGSGNIVLDGAATGFGSFAGSYTYNDALFYAVTDGINYEVGSGQYILDGSDDALTRFPFHSSNSNTAVDFPAGVKEVYVTYPGKYAVMTGSGLSGFDEPDASGLAFWGSNQILNYDSNVIWDKTNSRLGINNAAPSYTIDIGGEGTDSSIRVSGLIIGASGITFSNGVQLTAYTENALDATTGTDAVFALSGVSNQIIQFQEQNAGLFFAGPPSGCNPSGACAPDMPTFRVITDDDLPSLASMYLTQDPAAYDSGGMGSGVAFWATSGVVDHDPYFVWDKTQNFLGVNKLVPTKELDVDGDAIVSGAMTVGGDLAVFGSLDVQGSLTYIDSLTVTIADHQIELGSMSGVAVSGDAYINDGGIVIKSQDSDKKWTWIDATDAWTSSQSVDVPSVIFDDSSVISGAYHSGSGISIANGIEINIADVFKVAGNDAVTEDIFQADTLAISGVSGVSVSVTTNGAVKTITIDPSALISDVESSGNDNSAAILANSASGLVISGIADTNSTNISTNIANIAINVASGITNALGIAANSADIAINSASGAAISGWASTNFTSQDGRITVNEAGILANSASGVAFDGRVTTAEAGILANSASGTATSGWASTNFTSQGGRLTVNEAGILANSASGVAISGFADYTIDASGALLDTLIDAVSGWSQAYTDSISFNAGNGWNISDQLGNTEVITNNNLTISGVSGLNTFYDSVDDNLIVSGGTLETSIAVNAAAIIAETASGIAISGWSATNFSAQDVRMTVNEAHILANTASGVAISGWAAYEIDASGASLDTLINEVSGWAAAGGTNLTAGTGLFVNGGSYHTSGVGYFSNIRSYGISDPVSLGPSANTDGTNGVFIGRLAGNGTTGDMTETVSIGYNATQGASESNGGVFVGSAAGLQSNGNDDAVGIGGQALGFADDCYRTVGIGYFAGKESVGSTGTVFAGVYAGQESTRVIQSLGLGQYSLYQSNDLSSAVAIGYGTMYGSSGVDYDIGIGYNTLRQSVDSTNNIALGYSAMYEASGTANTVSIGYAAGFQVDNLDYNVFIGNNAGYQASGDGYSNIIGYRAGASAKIDLSTLIGHEAGAEISSYSSIPHALSGVFSMGSRAAAKGRSLNGRSRHVASEISNSVFIGEEAGYNTNNIDSSIILGKRAGSYDWNQSFMDANEYTINSSVVMGDHAAYKDDNTYLDDNIHRVITNCFITGSQAAYDVTGNITDSVIIGRGAGAVSNGANNIYIGKNVGSGISGDNNIILGSGAITGSVDNVINLNDTIVSYSTDHRYTRIGDIKDLSDTAALSIMPAQTDQNVLNLLHGQSAPTVDMMVAQTGASPFTTGRNAVVNKNGLLRIPSFADVSTATAAISATTNEGVLLFAGDSLLVSDGSVWLSGAMIEIP
jgi:hypothetical protein